MKNINLSYKAWYLLALILVVISLPLSKFLTSIGLILLAAIWLLEGNFNKKFSDVKRDIPLLVFLSIYLVHIIWLLHSSDFSYGLHDLQMKLPLLGFPIIFSSIDSLNTKQRKLVLSFFMLALFISAIIGIIIFLGASKKTITDAREISIFISHIRLALMLNLGIFSGIWMIFQKGDSLFKNEKIFYLLMIIVLSIFIFVLKSLTGIVVYVFLILFSLIRLSFLQENKKIRLLILVLIFAIPGIILGYSWHCYSRFYKTDTVDLQKLERKTASGNNYVHNILNKNTENGHYVWLYLSERELREGWNSRSNFKYDGKDKKGQEIKFTLIRYLTSKGLRKDLNGVMLLNEKDISLIESGIANYIYGNKWNFYPYVYRVIWEIDAYKKGDNPAGHSAAQRLVYLNIAKEIIKNNFWFGVGTGDVQKEFNKVYESKHNEIPIHWRRRAHNQFITFWIAFGLIGLSITLFGFFWPVIRRLKLSDYPGYIFILIAILSMLNEDTLETQAGATFIAFFYSFFFIMKSPEDNLLEQT